MAVYISVENSLIYISTNFYRTQSTLGDALTKMQGFVFLEHGVGVYNYK